VWYRAFVRVCPRCRSVYSKRTQFCGIDGDRLIDQLEDPLVGELLDRYHVVEKIGQGASGCVYRARHSELDTDFALKVLFGDLGSDETIVGRFRREAQTASKIRSPHVVSVVDFGTTPVGLTYLVMEYADGKSLRDIIQNDGALNPLRAARFTSHIARGLAAAHQRGFIHRDVKPANVVIAMEHGQEIAKLLDFGIVRIDQEAVDATKLTEHGLVVGTPAYMAPEQARNSEVTTAADIYALGVVLYEMIAGEKPFKGSNVPDIVYKHAHELPAPLQPANGLENLAMWMLSKVPAERPESVVVVAAEAERIQTLLSGSRTHDPQPAFMSTMTQDRPAQRVEPPKRSKVGLIAAASGVALAVIGAIAFASLSKEPAPVIPVPPPIAPPPPPVVEKVEPISAEILVEKLDALDEKVAALAGKLPQEEAQQIEARYLELYKQIRATQTREGLEDIARSVKAFEKDLAQRQLGSSSTK
jgi:serine/threonine protein kinase